MNSNLFYLYEKFMTATIHLSQFSGSRVNALCSQKSYITQLNNKFLNADSVPEEYKKDIGEICNKWNANMTEEDAQEICQRIANFAFLVTSKYFSP